MFVMTALYENPVALDHAKVCERMRALLDRLVTALDRDTFLDDLLDGVVDLLGADRGLIVLDGADVVNARGQGRALSAFEREEVSKTVMAEARSTGRCVVWEPRKEMVA